MVKVLRERRRVRPWRRAELELATRLEARHRRPGESGVEAGGEETRVDGGRLVVDGDRDQLDLGPDPAGAGGRALALYRPMVEMAASERGRLTSASLVYLVELAPELEDSAGCRLLRPLLIDHFGHSLTVGGGTVHYSGACARMLGELDLGCGEWDAAVEHLEEGLRVDAMLGCLPYVARGQLNLAR